MQSDENPSDFLSPPDLFDELADDQFRFWTCVRARPRWEKKLTRWLRGKSIPHFMPVFLKTTVSHRKRRTSTLPLFPGYVFVAADVSKSDLSQSSCVVRILKPRSDTEAVVLDRQLHSVWLAVQSGEAMTALTTLAVGQHIEITEGSMRGLSGTYMRTGRGGSLVLSVDMLGGAVAVEMPPDCKFLISD
jgi:transcription antitermination factor NusG